MAEHALQDTLHLVFTNLDYKDLYNASLVNSYWNQIATEENYKRGIISTILYNDDINIITDEGWKEEHFQYLIKMSSFNIFVVNVKKDGPPITNCYCNYHKPTCSSLILRIQCADNSFKFVMSVTFPDSHKLEINTFTFKRTRGETLIYCPELRCMSGPVFEPPVEMAFIMQRFFDKNSSIKSCMIIITDFGGTDIIRNFMENLKQWFPESDIFVWGGIVKRILTCKGFMCKIITECNIIFISKRNLKIWTIDWPAMDNSIETAEKNLQELKQTVKLQKYSFALIYRACSFLPFSYRLEILFQTVFPKMPYIYFYGPALLESNNLQVIFLCMSRLKATRQKSPNQVGAMSNSIMILTYD